MTTKRFRYRAYPTPEQEPALARSFGCARVVYNDVVRARQAAHKAGLPYPTLPDLSRRLITLAKKTPERAWLGEVSAGMLQQSLADADRAYRNFFAAMKKRSAAGGATVVGEPRLKTRKDSRQSIRFARNAKFKIRVVNRERALLRVPGVPGEVMFRLSRRLPSEPSSVTVIREGDGRYYLSFTVVTPDREVLPDSGRHAALTFGSDDFASVVASDGTREKVATPRSVLAAERRLARRRRVHARKETGSSNRAKARVKVAAAHRKVRETRLDHAHKLVLRMIRENQTVIVGQLSAYRAAESGAARRCGRLRRSAHDAAWGQVLRLLSEKAREYGRTVLTLDGTGLWRGCAVCGHAPADPLSRALGQWTCPACGTRLDRGWNTATNLLVAAGQTTGCAPVAETLNACGGDVRLRLAVAGPGEAGTTHARAA